MDLSSTIRNVQSRLNALGYHLDVDGKAGVKTWAAISDAILVPQAPPITTLTFDDRTEKNLATLSPTTREVARLFLRQVREAGINAKIIDGTRTYEEQDAKYEQGRSKPGEIVTNARGGYSWHNFGVAFDIGIFDSEGKYLEESKLYADAGKIGRELGLEWGGDWKGRLVDEPHYQYNPNRYSLATAREKHNAGEAFA